MKRNCDSLTHLSQQTRQVAENGEKMYSVTQTDVIFVVMNAVARIYEDDIIAMNSVTAMP